MNVPRVMACLQSKLVAGKRNQENNKKQGKQAFRLTFKIQLSTINERPFS